MFKLPSVVVVYKRQNIAQLVEEVKIVILVCIASTF